MDRFGLPTSWATRRFGAYAASEWQLEIVANDRRPAGLVPVVFCHGFSFTGGGLGPRVGTTTSAAGLWYGQMQAIAARTGIVVWADLGGGSTWANDTAIARIDTLITWMGTNLGTRTDKVVIAGESMGSLLALNWAWRNHQKVAAVWIRDPITRLLDFYNRNAVFQGVIDAAYTNHAGFLAGLTTHDPAYFLGVLNAMGSRTRVDYQNEDEFITVPEVKAYLDATGADGHIHIGDHEDGVRTPFAEVAEWIAQMIRQHS